VSTERGIQKRIFDAFEALKNEFSGFKKFGHICYIRYARLQVSKQAWKESSNRKTVKIYARLSKNTAY